MSKRETIERILARNPSARPEFLAEFSLDDLSDYLRQLESVSAAPSAACPSADRPAAARSSAAGHAAPVG